MDVFFHLIANLFPLYILIALGYAAGRYFGVERDSLAHLAIFILVPVVSFGFIAELSFKPAYILLPVLVFGLHAAMILITLNAGRKIYPDCRANLLALCGSSANTGYFGLPLVLLLFDTDWVGIYMLMLLGGIIYESTLAYYVASRGNFSVRESLIKLAKFPAPYAVALGFLFNFMQWDLPPEFFTYHDYFKGAYVVVGMMIIGAALAQVSQFIISLRFLSLSFIGKFLIWPLLAWLCIWLDHKVLQLFETEIHAMVTVMSLLPPAANTIAFAVQGKLNPEKAATTVLLATVFALFYIPAVLVFFGFY